MVLNNKCKKCNGVCNTIHFQHKFIDWTSGNKIFDKFIQDTQLSAHNEDEVSDLLEWIPYDRFYDIEFITDCKIYKANWIDGRITSLNYKNQNWEKNFPNMTVYLKNLIDPKEITIEFMNEVQYN
jgi:hypothetical protein